MKVFLFGIGARDRASSRLRVWDHAAWLREQGHDVEIDSLTGPASELTKASLVCRIVTRYPRWIASFLRADAVLMQESLILWPAMLLRNVRKRRRVVFDFSDPIDRIGRGTKRRFRRRLFDLVVSRADTTVVENRAYLDLLRGKTPESGHFYGPVDAERYGAGREVALRAHDRCDVIRIGWGGSKGTYSFIAPLMPIIDELARTRPIEVLLFGIPSLGAELNHAKLIVMPWNEVAEFETIPSFDLGLFRLEDTEDAQWRGAGKLFTYMAAGVPFIASDIGIAHSLMRETGVGFPVARDSDWPEALKQAIDDGDRRRAMIAPSLAFAKDRLSYQAYRKMLGRHLLRQDLT